MRLLHCDVFPIRFALIDDEDEFDRLAKRVSALDAYPGDGAACTYFSDDYDADGAVLIVVLGDCSGVDPVEIELLLVHESVHCAQNVFDLMAEDAAGTEIEAYTVQYFTRHLLTEYLNKKVQRKRLANKKRLTNKDKRDNVKKIRRIS